MRLFLDTNVVIDFLAQRQPWAAASTQIFALLSAGEHEGYVAPHTFTTAHYLMRKQLGTQRTAGALIDLVNVVKVSPLTHESVVQALALAWKDFEDALQVVSALTVDADCFVTRNPRDLLASPITVMDPQELLAHLGGKANPGTV